MRTAALSRRCSTRAPTRLAPPCRDGTSSGADRLHEASHFEVPGCSTGMWLRREVDYGKLKGRIGEALVENIFHLAGYRVARLGRESYVQRLLKDGEDEFSPDFLVWKPVDGMPGAFWLLNVEVKYRRD